MTIKGYKIEVRADCKECGREIIFNRFRTFCAPECRVRHNNHKQLEYHAEWNRKKRLKIKAEKDDALQAEKMMSQVQKDDEKVLTQTQDRV